MSEDKYRFRECMEREIAYTHWTDEQRHMLRLALKWFNEICDEGKQTPLCGKRLSVTDGK